MARRSGAADVVMATGELPRRVYPVVFVVDVSGSMADDAKIDVLNGALLGAVARLAEISDPEFTIHVAVLTYGDDAKIVQPLAPATSIDLPRLEASGRSNLGSALTLLCEVLAKSEPTDTAHYPAIILISDGYPTQRYDDELEAAGNLERFQSATRAAVRIGTDASDDHLVDFCRGSLGVLDASDLATVPEVLLRVSRIVEASAGFASSSRLRRG